MSSIIVETDRLVLRRWQASDLDVWRTHLNSPEVMTHLGGPRTDDQVAERFARLERCWEENGFSFLATVSRTSGEIVGTCGMSRIDTRAAPAALQGAAQIGWQLRADHWGRGLATEAARGVIAWGFGRCGIETLYGQTAQANPASWRIMAKLNMGRRVDLDYDDPEYPPDDNPTIIYALDRADWRDQPAAPAPDFILD